MSRSKTNIFLLVVALYWGSLYTYVPTLSAYADSLGASPVLLGMIIGSYGFAQMIIRLPLGIFSDKIQKRRIFITGGLLVSVVASLGCALFPYPEALLFFRGLSGVAASAWVTFTVLYASYFDAKSTPRAVATSMMVLGIGQAVFSYLGSELAARFGAAAPFWLSAGIGICGAVLSLCVAENPPKTEPVSLKELLKVASDKGLILVSSLAALAQFIIFSTVYSFTQTFAESIGATVSQLGILSVIFTVTNLIFSRIGGLLSAKMPVKHIVMAGFMLIALSCVLIPFGTVRLLFLFQVLFGMGAGFLMPMLMSLSIQHVEHDRRGIAMGFYQAVYGIGMTVGPVVGGFVTGFGGFSLNFFFMAVIAVTGAFVCLRFVRQ